MSLQQLLDIVNSNFYLILLIFTSIIITLIWFNNKAMNKIMSQQELIDDLTIKVSDYEKDEYKWNQINQSTKRFNEEYLQLNIEEIRPKKGIV